MSIGFNEDVKSAYAKIESETLASGTVVNLNNILGKIQNTCPRD